MTTNSQFIQAATNSLDRLGDEISDLQTKAASEAGEVNAWASKQIIKLKKDWEDVKTEMHTIATQIESEGEASVEDARLQAERHWEALRAAVKAYRGYLEETAAN